MRVFESGMTRTSLAVGWQTLSSVGADGQCKRRLQEADVYAFGVMLWELLSGVRAWAGLPFDMVVSLVTTHASQLRFSPAVPPDWASLGQACLSHAPAERPSFQQIVAVLTALHERVACPARLLPPLWKSRSRAGEGGAYL